MLVVDLPPPLDMGFDVSADAARFLVALPTKRQRAGVEIHVVLRGFDELRALAAEGLK